MNWKNKIKFALFTVIFVSLFLFTSYFASAGCCITANGCSAASTCPSGTYVESVCSELSQCDFGCCCSSSGVYALYGTRDACTKTNSTYAFTILPDGTNCNNFCDPSKTYSVSGYIKNSTGFLSGAIIENNINTVKVTTTSTGYYSFSDMPSSFTITASKSGCNAGTLTLTNIDSDKTNQDITLTCSACYWRYSDWTTTCNNGLYDTRNVIGKSSETCTDAQLGVPIVTKACELPSTCNNNILETGEECEINDLNQFVNGKQCASGSTIDCVNCKCDSHLIAEDPCLTDAGNFTLAASYTKHVLRLDISWSPSKPECNKYIDDFKLDKCVGTGCKEWNMQIQGKIFSYPDTTILSNKFYCYKLTANYNLDYEAQTGVDKKTVQKCFYAGDEYCFSGSPDPNCITNAANNRNGIISCDETNKKTITDCKQEEYCTFVDNLPVCKNQTKCEKCNAFFGLFGFQGIEIYLDSGNNECPSIASPSNLDMGCYLDYTKTAVDMSKECKEVASCYDYFSEENCVSDFCYKIENCEWIPYNKQFNKGVCRPINTENQNCNLCTEDANNRFYEDCTKDTCTLYGNKNCYFDGADCLNKSQMSCSNYISQEDCIGPVGKQQNVSVDVTWNSIFTEKLDGTNKLIYSSNDSLDLGRCKWMGSAEDGKCIKDADGNNTEDCMGYSESKTKTCNKDYMPPETTINNKNAYNTKMDISDELVVNDNSWVFRETTANSKYRINLYYCINTSSPTCYPNKLINRSEPLNSLLENKYWIDVPLSNEGKYNLFYYAEDPARNLEVVKNFTFNLDTTPPIMSLMRYYQVTRTGNDYRSNITFNIILNEEKNLPVTCTFSLKRDDAQNYYWLKYYNINEKEITAINGKLTTTYPDLGDGWYNEYVDCYDLANNHKIINDSLFIEGDMRINSATPSNKVFRKTELPKEIFIKTENFGTCRYSDSHLNYNEMSPNTFERTSCTPGATNCFKHNASMPLSSAQQNSGVHIYYTACNITLIGFEPEIVQGDLADAIYFSIDEIAPKTTMDATARNLSDYWECEYGICYKDDAYDSSKTTNYLEMNFMCNDSDSLLYAGTFSKYLSFGCNQTYYCLQESEEVCDEDNGDCEETGEDIKCDDLSAYDVFSSPFIIDYLNEDANSYYKQYGNYPELCYYSIDKGGNEENPTCVILNIKNTRFDEPVITIQVPTATTGGGGGVVTIPAPQ